MSTKVKGKTAKLIDEGSLLDTDIKTINNRLKEIKLLLTEDLGEGSFVTKRNSTVCIKFTDKYADIVPNEALNTLTKMQLGARFPECIKVMITPLKKLIGDTNLQALRVLTGKTSRVSFK